MRKDFSLIPQVRMSRTKFDMPYQVKTSMNVGDLVPIDFKEVLPGDTFSTDLYAVARASSAFIKPIMDNLYMDIYHFFVPYRLCFSDAEKVFGDPNPSAYLSNTLLDFPTFTSSITVSEKTVGDYLGFVPGSLPAGASVLPFRAFARIYNEWFRNENVVDETYVQMGSIGLSEVPNNNAWSPTNYMGKLPKVGKKKDYFTSCLPQTQKGGSVSVPIGTSAPVYTGSEHTKTGMGSLHFRYTDGNVPPYKRGVAFNGTSLGLDESVDLSSHSISPVYPSNLYADLREATASSVNDLRFAFQLQKMLERDALYGSRYNEYLLAHFGTTNPDSRLQFTEYLGGGRIPINITQVAQTSESSSSSPLGQVAGYSLSNGHSYYTKGFTEHGYVFTVACIRQIHTYQQGISKCLLRSSRNDFYDPLYANLGEQPVYRSELYLDGTESTLKDNVFGYNEAWADYRYAPNRISGEMRSGATNSLDIWHLADKYASAPVLGQTFVEENSSNIDRVLSVPSSSMDNFIVDFAFNTKAIRVMPAYSVPGLIDHH